MPKKLKRKNAKTVKNTCNFEKVNNLHKFAENTFKKILYLNKLIKYELK